VTEEPTSKTSRGGVLEQTIAGVIVLAIGAVAAWVFGLLSEAKVSIWVYVAGIVAAGVFATLVYAPWRRAVWGNVAKWRPLTTVRTLERAKAEGRAEAEADRKKHKPSIRAQWFIYPVKDEQHMWGLMNTAKGSIAKDVSVHVSNSEIKIGSALDWPEVNGGDTAKFMGGITGNGHRYGVDFTVAWTNEHGERLSANYSHESDRF